jgi:hypothetical protein
MEQEMEEKSEEASAMAKHHGSSGTDSGMESVLRESKLSKQHKNVIHRTVKKWDELIKEELGKENESIEKALNDPKKLRK